MASEIRVNSLTNRSGLSTVSITDAGLNAVGIITAHNFQTGTTNVHSTGVTAGDGVFTGNVSVTGNLNVSGVLTYDDVTNIDSVGIITARAGVKVPDNQKIFLGTGDDLQIYHDGSNSIIKDNGTGKLILDTDGTAIEFQKQGLETIAAFNADGAVELYHNNVKKLETTTAGVAIHEDTDKVVRFSGSIGEIGNVTGFQGGNTAGNALTDLGMRGTTLRFATGNSERLRISSIGQLSLRGTTTAFDGTGDLSALQMYYETDSGQASIGPYSSGGNTYLSFYTNSGGSAATEKLRITSDGKVGVGENTPASQVDIKGNVASTTQFSGFDGLRIHNANGATHGITADMYFTVGTATANRGAAIGVQYTSTASGNDLYFATNPGAVTNSNTLVERLRITSGGQIGMGIANPTQESGTGLHIRGANGGQTRIHLTNSDTGDTATDGFYIISQGAESGGSSGEVMLQQKENKALKFATNNTERLRITSGGEVNIGNNLTQTTYLSEISGPYNKAGLRVVSGAPNYEDPFVVATATGGERFRITGDGHKWTNNGSIFHGSSDITDFTDSSRDGYNNVSIRAGHQSAGTTPTNTNSAIKIYPAGVRSMTTGNLTGGIAWQHLDPNNSNWGTNFGSGSQIWMGAALHDTPGQERDRFNLWMNDQTTAGSNPNNLAIEAYPNGIVRHPKVPAFNAKGFSAHRDLSTWHNVDLNNWLYVDQNGSHYNNSNGRFTAPVAGKYFFIYTSMFHNPQTADFHNIIAKNGTIVVYSNNHSGGGNSNGHQWNDCTVQILITLAAGDYVTARSTGSSNSTTYLYGSGTSNYSTFCGFLIG